MDTGQKEMEVENIKEHVRYGKRQDIVQLGVITDIPSPRMLMDHHQVFLNY